ncbi:hypothetical protein B7463_g8577, partial [Scytalidium lignicola]
MELEPIDHYPQVQRLTTALKNICRDYPAGGTVLRELLQNADDAGATAVKFVLDEDTHPTDTLINSHLAQYQGPALLAYNNAKFTDDDFSNLSHIGDSLKLQDGLTTGKFGRGFNSVYNWTDSPSIISRDRLLILDPHSRWSTGGPLYDFVKGATNPAMKNQMAAFRKLIDDPTCALDGTVIRIPLRTSIQAAKSEISKRETTVAELQEVLNTFVTEFGNNGLLFMRNIEKLGIEPTVGKALDIEVKGLDGSSIKSQRSRINMAVQTSWDSTFNHTFDAVIEQSSISMSSDLKSWAKEQAFIPWVAIAARHQIPEDFQGSLYSVLPLPIKTGQPVHIHGIFSISPDRARLYQLSDTGIQDRTPALWNQWLFRGPVIDAWTGLLEHISKLQGIEPSFNWWPCNSEDDRDPLIGALGNLIEVIKRESLCLFPTDIGYASSFLIDIGGESKALREALKQAKIPVVYVPQTYRNTITSNFKEKILSPRTLCDFIRSWSKQITEWPNNIKRELLEYITSDYGFSNYADLPLFPFEDGLYRSITSHPTFIHRDEIERDLFQLEGAHNIDLNRISTTTKNNLKAQCDKSTGCPSIQFRSLVNFGNYFSSIVFKKFLQHQDTVELDKTESDLVLKAWKWIIKRQVNILDGVLVDLWLIPLENGSFRKIRAGNPVSEIIIAHGDETGDLLRNLCGNSMPLNIPLLKVGSGGLGLEERASLAKSAGCHPELRIIDAANTVDFAKWLNRNAAIVALASEEERTLVVKLLAKNLSTFHPDRDAIGGFIRPLKVFRKICWITEGNKDIPSLTWTSLDESQKSIGSVDGIIPVPELDGTQVLDTPRWQSHYKLLDNLQLASCKKTISIIEDDIIPTWGTIHSSQWSYSCKEQVARWILDQYSGLKYDSKEKLRTLDIVPVSTINGKNTFQFASANKLIDSSLPELTNLFFEEEEAVPNDKFLQDFHSVLIDCGLKIAVDEDLINNRIRSYAESKYPPKEIHKCVQWFVKSNSNSISSKSGEDWGTLRRLKWLPITDSDHNLVLKAPNECRGIRDQFLVNYQLPIFVAVISLQWEMILGWQDNIPNRTLLTQLRNGLQKEDRKVVHEVLTYIREKRLMEEVSKELMKIECILTSKGNFSLPSKVFRPSSTDSLTSCERLHPYIGIVDHNFWHQHKELLEKLNIKAAVCLEDLLDVERILETKIPLSDADKDIAIEILKIASHFPREKLLKLKVLTKEGGFSPIEKICYHNLGQVKIPEDIALTHPDIPRNIVQKLEIEDLSQQIINGIVEISDSDDEEEFEQREEVTTRISDTLDRYPIKTTFREYLANADDANASKISWLLDERSYSKKYLLTSQLERYQGPALLVHNDSTFKENDFEGFKNVGEGSKQRNQDTIGQFGRGSQTMYHWTDVPMILSGHYLIILDPQREVLPKSKARLKRKLGVKLLLSKVKDACPDQLAPFQKLWNYTKDLNYYPGTIFRFPFRHESVQSRLRVAHQNINSTMARKLMNEYFNEARISLLFLRNIRSIDFTVYGSPELSWSVNEDAHCDSRSRAWCFDKYSSELGHKIEGRDTWQITIAEIQPESRWIPKTPRRVMKHIRCGVAALISTKPTSSNSELRLPNILPPQLFSSLPLSIPSDLPVYLNGTFFLSGDRQSLIIDDLGQETQMSEWNQYILRDVLPDLYLSLLESLAKRIPQNVTSYWPQINPPAKTCSGIFCNSFWEKFSKSSRCFFPKAQINFSLDKLQLLNINQATFDFLPQPDSDSDILAPLLLSQGVNLVRKLPGQITKHLKLIKDIKSVSGSMLRTAFKTNESRIALQQYMHSNPKTMQVLWKVAIPEEEHFAELDGCCFLPLEDGNLGTLELLNRFPPPKKYYIASKDEIQLFQFAKAILLLEEVKKPLRDVLSSERFNVEVLQPSHINELLKWKPEQLSTSEQTQWLTGVLTKQLFAEFKEDLRSIPLWPTRNTEFSELICAEDAWIIQDPNLLVPWIKDRSRFIDVEFARKHVNCTTALGITQMEFEELLRSCIFPVPHSLSGGVWQSYISFISVLPKLFESNERFNNLQQLLAPKLFAAGGDQICRKASEYYDHEDSIFISAFRGIENRMFLNPSIRSHKSFWKKLGLRYRENGIIDGHDYLLCLQTLNQRLDIGDFDSDEQLKTDHRVVVSPLINENNVLNFQHADFMDTSRQEVFLSQTSNFDSVPRYRHDAMAIIAIDRRRLSLSDIISRHYSPVCWSQTPFPAQQPNEMFLRRITTKGEPSIDMVWRHLKFLSEIENLTQVNVNDFLNDLHQTYSYLQSHTSLNTCMIIHTDSRVWLNISWQQGQFVSVHDIESSWCSLDDLVLSSSCDVGSIKAVKNSLMRYEALLRDLGCNSITYPTVPVPSLHDRHSVSASLRGLRKKEKLLDVTFITEGRHIKAHKVVLAAFSEKCEHQFSGRWENEEIIRYDEDDDPEGFLSYHTLSTMINYAYEDEVDWKEMEVSDNDDEETKEKKLFMLLDLHGGADYWLIPELKSQVEQKIIMAGKKLLNIKNALRVRDRAREVRATATEKLWVEFIEQNNDTVMKASAEMKSEGSAAI